MNGPLEMVGDEAAPACEDGVCEIPESAIDGPSDRKS
ncbi:MAG: hypothetical protein JWQ70_1308 [Aeromicrobium sp.]|nr:hypothetical protein [Aeromicrobium sp.]